MYPTILVLASQYDFSCDYIASGLLNTGIPYLRLNSESLPLTKVTLDPLSRSLVIQDNDNVYLVSSEHLAAIYMRRPVYFREYAFQNKSSEESTYKAHWSTFIRNLMIFNDAKWINHPQNTYLAEHKAVQLSIASQLGFKIPDTFVTNSLDCISTNLDYKNPIAIKGLDTILLREEEVELFSYTQIKTVPELLNYSFQEMPVVFQRAIQYKTDIRVTVIEEEVFAVEVVKNDAGIEGDWRIYSRDAEFRPLELPSSIRSLCIELVRELGLKFGAIDLALEDNVYYFFEINPTGEWAWLVDSAGLHIDQAIVSSLIAGL